MNFQPSVVALSEGRAVQQGAAADKGKLSCLLHSQKPRQLAFAAELGRWAFKDSYESS
jgi:hypothetical protein